MVRVTAKKRSKIRHRFLAVLTLARAWEVMSMCTSSFVHLLRVVVQPRSFRDGTHVVVAAARHKGVSLDHRTCNLFALVICDRCRLLPVDKWLTLLFRLLHVTQSVSAIALHVSFPLAAESIFVFVLLCSPSWRAPSPSQLACVCLCPGRHYP